METTKTTPVNINQILEMGSELKTFLGNAYNKNIIAQIDEINRVKGRKNFTTEMRTEKKLEFESGVYYREIGGLSVSQEHKSIYINFGNGFEYEYYNLILDWVFENYEIEVIEFGIFRDEHKYKVKPVLDSLKNKNLTSPTPERRGVLASRTS